MSGALVLLSGGQDSTTCLFWAKEHPLFSPLHALTINYGQRHAVELEAAKRVAQEAGVASHEVLDIGPILKGTSPLISADVPEQYENWQSLPGGLEKTFVPARNILFLTIAANRAYCLGVPDIICGVSQEDFGGYPDCRQLFILQMEVALRAGLTLDKSEPMGQLTIHTPLINMSKADTVGMAVGLPGCYAALRYSHTAYDGAYPPTGKDHASLLRAKGFEIKGIPDPLVMRAVDEGLMPLPDATNYNTEAVDWYRRRIEEDARPGTPGGSG